MIRRVKRAQDKEDLFKQFTEGDYAVFQSMKDLLLFAACVGYKADQRAPLDKTGGEIPWSVFHGDTDVPIINSIALAETEDISILLDDEETYDRKLNIIEEYANYGMVLLRNNVIEKPGNPLDNLVAFIMENDKKETSQNSLTSFVDELF